MKFETKLEVERKTHNSYVSFDIVTFPIYGKNNVIWLSVKYQNFFSFQNVTYAYPPHAVNVSFISSHIKVSRSSLDRIYQHDCFTFHVGFFYVFFSWSWIQFFFKEMFVMFLYYNVRTWIVFRRAEFRCSKSLFSMLLFKNCISFTFTIDTLELKGWYMSACGYELSASIELSLWSGNRKKTHFAPLGNR